MAAEADNLINIVVTIPPDIKATFERRLLDAFSSDSFTDSARSWNAERLRVVQEVIDQHLIPAAIKWTREFIREEVEDVLAAKCGDKLRTVRALWIYVLPFLANSNFDSVLMSLLI